MGGLKLSEKGDDWDSKRIKEEELKKFMKTATEQFENDKNQPIDFSCSLSLYETKVVSELIMILRRKNKSWFGK